MSTPTLQQRLLCSKNSVTWLFITLSIIYLFYSINLILRDIRRSSSQCLTPLEVHHIQSNFTKSPSPLPSPNTTSPTIHNITNPTISNITKSSFLQNITHPISIITNITNITSSIKSSLNKTGTGDEEDDEECHKLRSVQKFDTQLKHVVFGIAASSNLWETRKEYIKVWWRPGETRGVVWIDQNVKVEKGENLPEIRISEDTTRFKYTHGMGMRSALRITRVVSETLKLGLSDVRWFVMGDDDTVFVAENVARALAKYDHNQYYYVGTSSESHVQNIIFSYNMAYGGGGFAISYPLAKELSMMQDRCIQRYPALYGSDDRIHACMTELGIPLTKEPGFHQYDVWGDLLGLLSAHPVAPLLSLHHLDVVEPIFPGMDRVQSLYRLFQSIKVDSASIIQQSICYDKKRFWSITISWGFVVQITRGVLSPRELEMPSRTFLNWYRRADYTAYAFNTRPVMKHPCQKPFVYYMNSTWHDQTRNQTFGVYIRDPSPSPNCRWKMDSPEMIDSILVIKKTDPYRWQKSPRRDCCRVLPARRRRAMNLWVGNCREGEVTELELE